MEVEEGQISLEEGEEARALRRALGGLFPGCSGGGGGGHKAQEQHQWGDRQCGACRGGPSCCTGTEHQPGRWLEEEEEVEVEWLQGVLQALTSLS